MFTALCLSLFENIIDFTSNSNVSTKYDTKLKELKIFRNINWTQDKALLSAPVLIKHKFTAFVFSYEHG